MQNIGNRRLFSFLSLVGVASMTGQAAVATVDLKTWHQKISGFGTCSAWNGTLTATEGEQLWSVEKGAGLSLHRIMIERTGAPDDNEKRNAKLATGYGVKVWGTPWYSKYAVKSVHGDYDTLAESNMQAWADDLAASARAMREAGTPLFAISPQNESDLGWVKYDAKALSLWVGKYLGPTMMAQAPEVKVMASEACNWYGFSGYEPVLMSDPDVTKYASIVSTHLYGGTMRAYPDIQRAGKEFWQTEIYDSKTDVEDPGIVSGLRIAEMIHQGLTVANFNAWHFWWIKPCKGCANGALWAESTNQPTKRLWVMGNWSKYVRPGFVRVEAPVAPSPGVHLTAFRDSALTKVVLVAVNGGDSEVSQEFSIPGATLRNVAVHVTDATRDISSEPSRVLGTSSFRQSLPARSVTTMVLEVGPRAAGILDGSFEEGAAGWKFNVWGGKASGGVVDGEYRILIDSVGSDNSSIQLVQNGILLEQGKTYQVRFDAYASSDRTLEANVEQDESPWATYLSAPVDFDLTPVRRSFSYSFTMTSPTDSNGRVGFNVGTAGATVFLDNVSIRETEALSGTRKRGAATLAGISLVEGMLALDYTASANTRISVALDDVRGHRILDRSFEVPVGSGVRSVSLEGIPQGVYLVRVRGAGRTITRSMIWKRP
ncbi:MAG: carbohydrate binding domain-containing protein [Fibrobacteria bacterium]|nr:carbohydrate binding domain-containing protein [Fibrobacteria bacterium]